ncbi:sugar phosphate isomerase/epimerase family protein [Lacticaseibacillus baoqingensis]|uniref:Sugar phosphate isomerase/epimerase family protein n=1 Tax=Lacticaseibacillus baoqingensis TaxID=2486013 RepID=A0ABW4E895_9LACO
MAHFGYEKVDLWLSPVHYLLDPYHHDDTNNLSQKLRDLNLSVSCLTPSQSAPQAYNLATGDDYSEYVKNYFRQAVYVAHELDVTKLLITPGWYLLEANQHSAWTRSVIMCRWLCNFAASYGVTITFEPLLQKPGRLVSSLADVVRYLSDVNANNLAVTVDTGTIVRNGEMLQDYLMTLKNSIDYCHFTNYAKSRSGHVAWQDGELSLKETLAMFEKYGYCGDFCLEYTDSCYDETPAPAFQETMSLIRELEG